MTETSGHGSNLTYWICGAIVAAIALALTLPHVAESLEVGGELFLRLLKMIVVPLVFTSVLCGIMGLGDVRKLGKPGAAAIGYYLCTTVIAVIIGLVVVNVIRPGEGTVDKELLEQYSQVGVGSPKDTMTKSLEKLTGLSREEISTVFDDLPTGEVETPTIGKIFKNLLLTLVSENLFVSAAETQLLPIIVFAILFGAMLTTMPGEVTNITSFITQANAALMKFVLLLMNVAPIGIFCLVTAAFRKGSGRRKVLGRACSDQLVLCNGDHRVGDSCAGHPATDFLGGSAREPVSLHDADLGSSVDGVFNCQLVGDPASDDGMHRACRDLETIDGVCDSARCDDQHGRHGALRSSRGDLHRAGDRL